MGAFIDLTGKRFGRLFVLHRATNRRPRVPRWACLCECGAEIETDGKNLRNGDTTSCGCYQRQRVKETKTTHGQHNTRLHGIWENMKHRCYNPGSTSWRCYGAIGIVMCDEWRDSFAAFYEWATKSGYRDDLEIDRIDGRKNYSPNHCRWATRIQQCRNTRKKGPYRFKGIGPTRDRRRWIARICVTGVLKHLGVFKTALQAALAYDDAAHSVDPVYFKLNFPERFNRASHPVPQQTEQGA